MKKVLFILILIASTSFAEQDFIYNFQMGKSWNKYSDNFLEYKSTIEKTSIYVDLGVYMIITPNISLGFTFNESMERFYNEIKEYEHIDSYMYGMSILYFPHSEFGLFLRGDIGASKMEKTQVSTPLLSGENLEYKSDEWGIGYSIGLGYRTRYIAGNVMISRKAIYDNSVKYNVDSIFFTLGINLNTDELLD